MTAPRFRYLGPEGKLLVTVAATLLCLRLPFLPSTLEDIDSVSFDLGVHDYNPPQHQPHPPGYPVFILVAKLVHPLFPSHAAGLGFVSALFSSLSLFPLYFLMRELTSRSGAALVCALTLFNPLLWFNGVRPMSDSTGFFAAIASQCLVLGAMRRAAISGDAGGWLWRLSVVAAGFAVGVRLQVILLIGPLLLYGWFKLRSLRAATLWSFAAGLCFWLIPLIYESGGPVRLAQSFGLLVTDALPVEPLATNWTLDRAAWAALDTFVTPWGRQWLGVTVLVFASAGVGILAFMDRRALTLASLLFLPYAIYHYLFQLTEVTRYALPIVPLVAFLASVPFTRWRQQLGVPVPLAALVFTVTSGFLTGPALLAYHSTPSPPAQAIERLKAHTDALKDVVVGGHHVFARYLAWLPTNVRVLQPVPRKEWRLLTEYWKQGGRSPILFLREPMRTSLLLIGPDSQTTLERWSWPSSVAPLIKGQFPGQIELVRLDPPAWFCESGFLTTLEAGPIEQVAREPHRLFVRASPRRKALTVSGTLRARRHGDIALVVDGKVQHRWRVRRRFTFRTVVGPFEDLRGYVPVSLDTAAPVLFTDVWLEPEDRGVVRPAEGFYFPERDEKANLFRWIAPEAHALVYLPRTAGRLKIRGQIPLEYYRLPVTLSLRWQGKPLRSFVVHTRDFQLECPLPRAPGEAWSRVTLSSSHRFIPDAVEKNGDRRVLALRVYELSVEEVDESGAASGQRIHSREKHR